MKIRGNYFGRLFLLLFTMVGTWFIGGFVNYSNAFQFFEVSLDKTPSYWNDSYEVGVIKRGDFITNYLNTNKAVMGISDYFYIWWFNNRLYWYDYGNNILPVQGFVQYYRACDSFNGTGEALTDCGQLQAIDGNTDDVISDYLSAITFGDLVYLQNELTHPGCGAYCSYWRYKGDLCFSHSGFNSSLCFHLDVSDSSGLYGSVAPLTSSMDLGSKISMGSIPTYLISRSPGNYAGQYGGNVSGGSNEGESATMEGDVVYSSCTNGAIYQYYKSQGYDERMCYAGVSSLDSTGIIVNVPGIGLTYRDVYNYSSGSYYPVKDYGTFGSGDWNLFSWLDYWRSVYSQRYVLSSNPFNNYSPALYYLFDNINNYSIGFDSIKYVDYCSLILYSDFDENYLGPLTTDFGCDSAGNVIPRTPSNQNPGSDSSDWSGIGNLGGGGDGSGGSSGGTVKTFNDGKTFMNNFFDVIKKSVIMPNKSDFGAGTLPTYIIVFMLALILFRFLSH